jgi:hypothetical protein
LIFKQWWTNWRGKADDQGRCQVRAFFGSHRVTAGSQQQIVFLRRAEPAQTVSFREP